MPPTEGHQHTAPVLGVPPDWSLWVGSLGRTFIFLAVAFFLATTLFWVLQPRRDRWGRWGTLSFVLGCTSLFGAFGSLATLFINQRFEFAYVYGHSDAATTLAYRVAAVWSGQQGSFLLWACCSAIFGLIALRSVGVDRRWYIVVYALFLGAISGILAYESPFLLNLVDGKPVVPPDGVGLQPSLLNYWVTIHPPTIFLGFGSLTVLFAWAFSALLRRDLETWVRPIRPYAIVCMTLLGLGLCMGGFWAYETLGWGGFWAWDPVENVSFVPWCITVALVHGLYVQAARKKGAFANAMLAGCGLLSFVYGTFLTRSGLLGDTSVHSFAEMDRSALRILVGVLGVGILAFLVTWTVRWRAARKLASAAPPPEKTPFHREAFLSAGMWLILATGVGAGIGMSVPLVQALLGQAPKRVEEHTYHLILVWLYLPLMVVMGMAPFLSWRAQGGKVVFQRLTWVVVSTLTLLGIFLFWIRLPFSNYRLDPKESITGPFGFEFGQVPLMALLVGVSLFVLISGLWRLLETWKRSFPAIGGMLTHFGIGVTMLGLVVSRGFERSEQFAVPEDRPVRAMEFIVEREGRTKQLFDRTNEELFRLTTDRGNILMHPGLYYIEQDDGRVQPFAWPHVHRFPLYDLYLVVGALSFDDPFTREFKVGEEVLYDQTLVKYLGMRMEGQPGQVGTKFIADVQARVDGQEYRTSAVFEMTEQGPRRQAVRLTPTLLVQLDRMDAGTKSVTLTLSSILAYYPAELFFKPMTGLVWVGVGIMSLGGFLAAWSRRRLRSPGSSSGSSTADSDPKESESSEGPALEIDHASASAR
ncbi:MAG TPA: cytochrome c biogenesis protein CcsA [Fimbriimonadaceae bacterium]|nr:cytochrome c biogenesis protein CcsA [Fimbriimonadaceae bacterium]HRJ32181.1 cytochrome c biogenesis protein CcsA [Fimbriimonadaceae bacterium]